VALSESGIDESGVDLKFFFKVATQMVKIMRAIHHHHIIHKNINLHNLWIHPKTEFIQLIDFSIATRLTREHQNHNELHLFEKFLPYISPEQTGRMNREIDYRTDYYSLGVSLYELLTGSLPFSAEDKMGWIHCHIAQKPTPPHQKNPKIPVMLSKVILKLLAKNAEDRYQSTHGLLQDLETCRQQWMAKGTISPFQIGQGDISEQFQIPQTLFGREKELKSLLNTFDQISEGPSVMMLIGGYSGIGKTVLIHEVHKPIIAKHGYFIDGKFDQFQRNIPYSAITQAFSSLMRQLLTESSDQLQQWKTRIQTALGTNGSLMTDILPNLEQIIGKQSSVPELPPAEAQNRFQLTFRHFINVFAKSSHPLVLFLDDLQWGDSSSLNLIQELTLSQEIQYLFIIGAYRNNEVNKHHPLMLMRSEIEKVKPVPQLFLEPLELYSVREIVTETLHCDSEAAHPLAKLLYQKTEGNPFFVHELLKNLHEEEYITFHPEAGQWQWDIEKIQAMEVNDNVVDFMISRLHKLPEKTQQVLQMASCIGHTFELKILAAVTQLSPVNTALDLWVAVQEGIIVALNDQCRTAMDQSFDTEDTEVDLGALYKFQHDRIQQATHLLVEEHKQQAVHLKIGRLMLRGLTREEKEEHLIEIARQLNAGYALITDPQEKQQLLHLNVRACNKAKTAAAYKPALEYISIAKSLLPIDIHQSDWGNHYTEVLAIVKEYASCAYLASELEDAELHTKLLLSHAKTKLEKAEILHMQALQYVFMRKQEDVIQTEIQGLSYLGIRVPTSRPQLLASITSLLLTVKWKLRNVHIANLINTPPMTDPEKILSVQALQRLGATSVIVGNEDMMGFTILKQLQLTLKHGNSPDAAMTYMGYAILLQAGFNDLKNAYEFGKMSMRLHTLHPNLTDKCRIPFFYAFIIHSWNHPWQTMMPYFKQALNAGYECGDLEHLGYACSEITKWQPMADLETLTQEAEKYMAIIADTKYDDLLDSCHFTQQFRLSLRDLTPDRFTLSSPAYDAEQGLARLKKSKFMSGIETYYQFRLILCVHFEDYQAALHWVQQADPLLSAIPGVPATVEYSIHAFLACAGAYPELNPWMKMKAKRRMRKEFRKMKHWSDYYPANTLHHTLLMEAELARIAGQKDQASRLYHEAIETVRANKQIRYEALTCEKTALFYDQQGYTEIASLFMKQAHQAYGQWKAMAKVAQLEESYPHLFLSKGPSETEKVVSAFQDNSRVLDMETVMKASHAISEEIHLGRLLEKLIKTVVENAGAEKGFLILKEESGDQLFIQTEFSLQSGESVVLQTLPLEKSDHIPVSVVQFAARTNESVVLHDAAHDGNFTQDPYIVRIQPKSVLCSPILNQGKLVGLVYLENEITAGAFTEDRLEVLQVLSSQAAISISNASLYANLEEKVVERTQELQQSYDDLKRTKIQLGETEKIASLTNTFKKFVPENFLNRIAKEGFDNIRIGNAESGEITVLFSDIRAFTTMTETMAPQEILNFLNAYLQRMNEPIIQHNGFVDKFIGDAIMALFDHPEGSNKQEAQDAVNAAIAMQEELKLYNHHRRRNNYAPIRMGIGIHSGPVIFGTVGSENRMDSTVLGDSVNLASRLEGLTKYYHSNIIVSAKIFTLLDQDADYLWRELDFVNVKGKGLPVSIYEIFNTDADAIRDKKQETFGHHHRGLMHFHNREWETALECFKTCLELFEEDVVPKIYIERCQNFQSNPPPVDWNGATNLENK